MNIWNKGNVKCEGKKDEMGSSNNPLDVGCEILLREAE